MKHYISPATSIGVYNTQPFTYDERKFRQTPSSVGIPSDVRLRGKSMDLSIARPNTQFTVQGFEYLKKVVYSKLLKMNNRSA